MHHPCTAGSTRTSRTSRTSRIARTSAAALALLLAATLGLTGCSSADTVDTAEDKPATAAFPVTVTDDAGREVTIESAPERIVSLAPANTEIVYALGLLDKLQGVTTYDDYPAEVTDIAKVGDFVTPNMEAIAAAKPDLILATTGVQADVITQLEGTGATVVAIDPQTLDALYTSIETVGKATGTAEEATQLVETMKSDIAAISEAVSAEEPTEAFIEIAQDPLYTAGSGTLLHDLIVAAGGVNIVTEPGYVGYSLEQLVTDDPTVYLATLGSMSDPSDLAGRAGYDKLSAVKNKRVYVLEDNLVSRPGPRVVAGIAQIAEALHPDVELPAQ